MTCLEGGISQSENWLRKDTGRERFQTDGTTADNGNLSLLWRSGHGDDKSTGAARKQFTDGVTETRE